MRRPAAFSLFVVSTVLIGIVSAASSGVEPLQRDFQTSSAPRLYDGPPLTLAGAIEEALAKNPELLAVRQQTEVARQRPAQERFLNAPMAEAQIWQWPLNSVNPADTNMYMFMVTQELPGRGKRQLRATIAEKEVALAESDVAIRARDVVNHVKQAYASLFIARKAVDVTLTSVELLREITDVSQTKYVLLGDAAERVLGLRDVCCVR